MAKDVAERIAELKAKRNKLGQRLNALEQKAKTEDRKRDTRRKIIVGGAIIAQMEKMPEFATLVRTVLNASVGRQNDREAIADLLDLASNAASAAVPEKRGVSPAPVPRATAFGLDVGKPAALSASPQPHAPAPPFLAPRNPQPPLADPLASTVDDLARRLGRKSE